ncbi:hypothetical protein D3C75_957720 [compost metagenome]
MMPVKQMDVLQIGHTGNARQPCPQPVILCVLIGRFIKRTIQLLQNIPSHHHGRMRQAAVKQQQAGQKIGMGRELRSPALHINLANDPVLRAADTDVRMKVHKFKLCLEPVRQTVIVRIHSGEISA